MDLTVIVDAVKDNITTADIATVIGAILAAAFPLALLWFGAKKVIEGVWSAFTKGTIEL